MSLMKTNQLRFFWIITEMNCSTSSVSGKKIRVNTGKCKAVNAQNIRIDGFHHDTKRVQNWNLAIKFNFGGKEKKKTIN